MGGHEKPSPVMVGKNGIRLPQNYGLSYMDYIDMTKWYVQIPLDDIYIYIYYYHYYYDYYYSIIILYYTLSYYIILFYIILYYIISYYIILYYI